MGLNKFFAWLTGDAKSVDGAHHASCAEARDEIDHLRRQHARDIATLGCAAPTPPFAAASKTKETSPS